MPARPDLPRLPGTLRFTLMLAAVTLFASRSAQGAQESSEGVSVQKRPISKGHRSVSVVAGESLEISCTINKGNNTNFQVRWMKDDKILNVDPRAQNSKFNYTNEANFTYLEAEPEHSGVYKCQVINENDKVIIEDSFLVRVKDKLGALWPFLAICGECLVLLIIILVYEKRRNKAEMEESDTDGSPDQ